MLKLTLSTGGDGAAPMEGRMSVLPRIRADQSWFANTPCGFWVMASFAMAAVGSGQKKGFAACAGWRAGLSRGQKLLRFAVKPESLSGASGMRVNPVGGVSRNAETMPWRPVSIPSPGPPGTGSRRSS